MEDVQTILVIILSVGLAALLLLAIVVAVILIRIVKNIRHITQRLDETSENMGELAKYFGKKVAPDAVSVVGNMIWDKAKSKVKRGK